MQVFINSTKSILNLYIIFFGGDVTGGGATLYLTLPLSLSVTTLSYVTFCH